MECSSNFASLILFVVKKSCIFCGSWTRKYLSSQDAHTYWQRILGWCTDTVCDVAMVTRLKSKFYLCQPVTFPIKNIIWAVLCRTMHSNINSTSILLIVFAIAFPKLFYFFKIIHTVMVWLTGILNVSAQIIDIM